MGGQHGLTTKKPRQQAMSDSFWKGEHHVGGKQKRVDSLCRQGLTFASAAVGRMPDFAAPEPPAEEEEQRNSGRRLHAVSVLLSWYSAPASSMAESCWWVKLAAVLPN